MGSAVRDWESEFLQMAVFVLLTTCLVQKGSPESRRPGVKDRRHRPTGFRGRPRAPWPVRRGGWMLRLYEHSLGLAFIGLFLVSWAGHAARRVRGVCRGSGRPMAKSALCADYLASPRFWFESFQNWQSECLAIAAMVWLAVSQTTMVTGIQPVHAPHDETGPECTPSGRSRPRLSRQGCRCRDIVRPQVLVVDLGVPEMGRGSSWQTAGGAKRSATGLRW